jgi:pimeloyl-ACP methyl ester carboxylesterase
MKGVACALGFVLALWPQTPSGESQGQSDVGGRLVDIGEHRLFLSCGGAKGSGPTVVMEAGGGGTSAEWTAVRDQLGPDVRVCAYDRAGLGQSDPGPAPRTMHQEVFELDALLQAANERPPFLMVGQSIGGLLVRLYAAAHPGDVVGLVLVDPTHESAVLGSLRYGGWVRLREKATGVSVPEPRSSIRGGPPENPSADYMAEEFQQMFIARQQTPQALDGRPLIVLAAGKRPAPPPGTSDELWKSLRDERDEQVRDLVGLSSNAAYIRDDASGHNLHRDNPALVVQSIREVRDAAMRGTRLGAAKP